MSEESGVAGWILSGFGSDVPVSAFALVYHEVQMLSALEGGSLMLEASVVLTLNSTEGPW